jgi:hypothetical protein
MLDISQPYMPPRPVTAIEIIYYEGKHEFMNKLEGMCQEAAMD